MPTKPIENTITKEREFQYGYVRPYYRVQLKAWSLTKDQADFLETHLEILISDAQKVGE